MGTRLNRRHQSVGMAHEAQIDELYQGQSVRRAPWRVIRGWGGTSPLPKGAGYSMCTMALKRSRRVRCAVTASRSRRSPREQFGSGQGGEAGAGMHHRRERSEISVRKAELEQQRVQNRNLVENRSRKQREEISDTCLRDSVRKLAD